MRKASVVLVVVLFLAQFVGQQTEHITVAGCVMNVNGSFKLHTQDQTYVLKGHHNELFGYNGMLIEVTGTVSHPTHPGLPAVLTITKLKKLADSCY
jgi:urea transporter